MGDGGEVRLIKAGGDQGGVGDSRAAAEDQRDLMGGVGWMVL